MAGTGVMSVGGGGQSVTEQRGEGQRGLKRTGTGTAFGCRRLAGKRDIERGGGRAKQSTGTTGYALAIPSSYATSNDVEFSALLSFLRRHNWGSHTVLIFSHNKEVVDTINALDLTTYGPHPSQTTHGTWKAAFYDFLTEHNIRHLFSLVWIKAHVGFLGNKIADRLGKWTAFFCPSAFATTTPPTCSHPPPLTP